MIVFREHGEKGAVTIIVALFVTVLFGFMALAVDVARMYEEKRQLVSSADLSALAGAQFLWKGKTEAEAEGESIVTNNPTTARPGAYNEGNGDLVEAKRQGDGTGCGANVDSSTGSITLDPNLVISGSQYYDCVQSTVTAPAFRFLFASALGFQPRSISAKATAFMGNGAPRGTTIVPWLLRDCPNSGEFSDETAVAAPNGCPYTFTDSYVNDPSSPLITEFSESGLFVGASLPTYNASGSDSGCPLKNGDSDVFHDNSTYMSINAGTASLTPCRIAPGLRLQTRGGSLGAQLKTNLEARGATVANCANATAFTQALGRTGDGDGYVSIRQKNACLVQVAFVVHAAPVSRVPTVDDNVAGTAAQMQANIVEASGKDRFEDLGNNEPVVIRRLAWYYITGYTSGSQSAPIGVYLRAIDNDTSIIHGPMDVCPSGTPIAECAQHGIYVVKLVG